MGAAADIREKIRVLIADDHEPFAQALEAILATEEGIDVAGHAGDGAEAVKLTLALTPDVVLMDIAMPVMDGFEATTEICKVSHAAVLMLTGSDSPADVGRAREAGAVGYVMKDKIATELVDSIVAAVPR